MSKQCTPAEICLKFGINNKTKFFFEHIWVDLERESERKRCWRHEEKSEESDGQEDWDKVGA